MFHLSLCWSVFLGLLVAYLPSYFDGSHLAVTPEQGSRYWPAFARWDGWRRLFTYFPASLIVHPDASGRPSFDYATAAKNGGQFVFAMHPHGMLSIDHFLVFTDCVGFLSTVAPLRRRDLGASVIFSIPILRELVLWLGVVDAGARTGHNVLSSGYSMQLYPGGIQEQIATNDSRPCVVAKHRFGFVKLALSYDTPIVPVYVFGEDKLFTSIGFMRRARQWMVSALRVGLPLFYGRLDRLGLIPHQRPLVAVVGAPLWPEGVNPETQRRDAIAQAEAIKEWKQAQSKPESLMQRQLLDASKAKPVDNMPSGSPATFSRGRRVPREPSKEEVNAMLDRYTTALNDLFEAHKANHKGYENATLDILSASR